MTKLLEGKQVVAALNQRLREDILQLKAKGIIPTLAIVRVGERPDEISYERAAARRGETIGAAVRKFTLAADVPQDKLLSVIDEINMDAEIHGCLILRPLPAHIDDKIVRNRLLPAKDIDGITDDSLTGVFTGTTTGFPPCTAQACIEILNHFGIDPAGKRAVVMGRSLVVGKPLAMMLDQKNATVTVCHRYTNNAPAICRDADIIVVAVGRAGLVGKESLRAGQIVIDVGINIDDAGKLCGDVNFEEAEALVAGITPVPGGVGTVTTSVLIKHVVMAANTVCYGS